MRSAAVIGASSMVGTHLVNTLKAGGTEVLTVGRNKDADIRLDLVGGFKSGIPKGAHTDVIIHCAASIEGDTWLGVRENYLVNAYGCSWALELAERLECSVMVFAGSISSDENSDPDYFSSYGLSKAHGEKILEWGMNKMKGRFCSLRFSQIYDTQGQCYRHQPWFGRIIAYAARGLNIWMPDSNGRRNFLHVDDVVNLLIAAGRSDASGILNVTHPESLTYQEIASDAYEIFNKGGEVIIDKSKIPFRIVRFPSGESAFKSLGYSPAISMDIGLKLINTNMTWRSFGPLDVA